MTESWANSFVQGAADSSGKVLAFAIVWISCLWSTTLLPFIPLDYGRRSLALVYFLLALQIAWLARRLGSYRNSHLHLIKMWLTAQPG